MLLTALEALSCCVLLLGSLASHYLLLIALVYEDSLNTDIRTFLILSQSFLSFLSLPGLSDGRLRDCVHDAARLLPRSRQGRHRPNRNDLSRAIQGVDQGPLPDIQDLLHLVSRVYLSGVKEYACLYGYTFVSLSLFIGMSYLRTVSCLREFSVFHMYLCQGGVIMFGALLLFEDEFIHIVSIRYITNPYKALSKKSSDKDLLTKYYVAFLSHY